MNSKTAFMIIECDKEKITEVIANIEEITQEHSVCIHKVSPYHYFAEFIDALIKFSEKKDNGMVSIIKNAMLVQVGFATQRTHKKKKVSLKNLKEYIDMIFRSNLGNPYNEAMIHYEVDENSDIYIPDIFYDVIIFQLIINIKQYSTYEDNNVQISLQNRSHVTIILKNKINLNRLPENNDGGMGLILCENITRNLNKLNNLECNFNYERDETKNEFKVTLTWKYTE